MAPQARHSRGAAILAVAAAATLSWCVAVTGGASAAAAVPQSSAPSLAWHELPTAASPPARSEAAVTYDQASNYMLLFGGTGAGGHVLDDTWTFNGTTWTQVQPAQSPPPLTGASMAYDATLGQLLLFGGSTTAGTPTPQNQTWAWNGATWIQLNPADNPPARTEASLTNVEAGSGSFVLFGGLGAASAAPPPSTPSTTTTSTTSASTTGAGAAVPAAAGPASANADNVSSSTASTVTAAASGGAALGDTWVWNGTDWTEAAPTSSSPSARVDAAATWDASRHQVVLVGGSTDGSGSRSALLADQWAWNGTGWSPLHSKSSPPARAGATLNADTEAGGDVLVAGQEANGPAADAWLYRGGAWTKLTIGGTLPGRADAGGIWDSAASRLFVTGGLGPGGALLADTYALGPAPAASPPTPTVSRTATTVATTPATKPKGKATPPVSTTTTLAPSTLVTTKPATTRPTSQLPSIVATPGPSRSTPVTTGPPLAAAPHTMHPGEQVVVSGGGYEPRTRVVITFHSTPVLLGNVATDASGHFAMEVTVPANAPPGAHHFVAQGVYHTGKVESFSVPVEVTLPAPGGSSAVRTAVLMLVVIGTPVVTWVVMAVGSRRRRRAEVG